MRLSIEEGLSLIIDVRSIHSWTERPKVHGVPCRRNGLRLMTFKHKGVGCVKCGIKGSFFAIERSPDRFVVNRDAFSCEPYHMNLYAVSKKGEEVLMTHDHILARALGGRDTLENSQPMCEGCNSKKGSVEQKLVDLIRKFGIRPTKLVEDLEIHGGPEATEPSRKGSNEKGSGCSHSKEAAVVIALAAARSGGAGSGTSQTVI